MSTDSNKKKQKKGNWKKTALTILCVFLALILVALTVVVLWFEGLMGSIGILNPVETASPEQLDEYLNATDAPDNFTGEELEGNDVDMPDGPATLIDGGKHIINVLLLGQDRRSGSSNGRSDAMILCTINTEEKSLTMTSFMRDTWVKIPGKYNERLNVAYMLGGFELLNETLRENFGVEVDYNVEVDFKAFEKVVDILGGVEVELSKGEANYLYKYGNWDVDDSTAYKWKLKEGKNLLTGEQAVAYSRIREVGGHGDGDFGRTSRQRMVLGIILDKAKEMSLTQMISTANTVIPLLATDMTKDEILAYIRQLAPMLSDLTVVNQRIPADGMYQLVRIDGKSVIKVNFEKAQKLLAETIGD